MWVRIDDATPYHPKMFHVGVCAFGWWTAALAYCNRNLTDGFIPERDYLLVYPGTPAEKVVGMIEMLVAERLLEKRSDHEVGVQVHDYLKYQTSRKDVLHIRRVRSVAGRKGGEKARKKDRANCSLFALSNLPTPLTHSQSQSQSHTQSLKEPTNTVRVEAQGVLDWLNQKTGKHYRPVATNLDLIQARIDSGISAAQLRAIVSRKTREWQHRPDMAGYLRPETLFNKTKCEQYFGELPALEGPDA